MNKIKSFLSSPLVYILFISFIIDKYLYSLVDNYTVYPDTLSYIDFYKDNLFQGQLNNVRTPVYPYFCKIIKHFFGKENLYNNIVIVQKLLFFISIVIFYMTLRKIFKKKITSVVITFMYSICPFIVLWNTVLLTESLTIFELILLLYLTISYIKKQNKIYPVLIGLLIFLMIMTRPASLILIPIYLLIFVIIYFKDKNKSKLGLISIIFVIFLTGLYSYRIKMLYGPFNITAVGNINNLMLVANSDQYEYGDNKEIVNDLRKLEGTPKDQNRWTIINEVYSKYGDKEVSSFCKSVIIKSNYRYIFFLVKRFARLSFNNIGTIYAGINNHNNLLNILGYISCPLIYGIAYLSIFISFIYIFYVIKKYKDIDITNLILLLLIGGNISTAIVFAPFEENRLCICSIPLLLIFIPYLFKYIFIDKKKVVKKSIKKNTGIKELFDYIISIDINNLFRTKTDNTFIQFFRYLFVGGIAAVVNIGMLYVFTDIMHIHYIISNILAFILGLITNYILSKKFVFQEDTSISRIKEFIIYAIIGVIGLGLDTLFIWLFTDKLKIYYMISKLVSTMIVFIWNFGARKVLYKIIK